MERVCSADLPMLKTSLALFRWVGKPSLFGDWGEPM